MSPLQSLPPELVAGLLEQGGPTAAVAALLWWRINKLEKRVRNRLDKLEEDIGAHSSLLFDRLLGQEYPGGRDAASSSTSRSSSASDPPAPLHDPHLEPEEHQNRSTSSSD